MELRRIANGSVAALLAFVILCTAVLGSSAISDNGLWEDSTYCPILDANGESNSDLCFAAVKVRYDYQINRIYLLFTLEFEEFNSIDLCGVIMNFNGLGNIKVMCDGTAEYNNSVYFAELEDELHDVYSKNVLIEATVGIKNGIPEKVEMKLNVIDTNGVISNTYGVDITEESVDPIDEESQETTKNSSAEKTTKEKTTKVKTTKIKTTKVKTTKVKTTKTKTTKTTKAKTKKANADKDDEEEEDASQVVIDSSSGSGIETDNSRKKLMLALGAAAATVAVAAGCAAGIKNRKKDRDGGHE